MCCTGAFTSGSPSKAHITWPEPDQAHPAEHLLHFWYLAYHTSFQLSLTQHVLPITPLPLASYLPCLWLHVHKQALTVECCSKKALLHQCGWSSHLKSYLRTIANHPMSCLSHPQTMCDVDWGDEAKRRGRALLHQGMWSSGLAAHTVARDCQAPCVGYRPDGNAVIIAKDVIRLL